MSFQSYLGQQINLQKFLKKILKSNGEKFLIHNVNHDDGLVESANNDAKTWLALSEDQDGKIAWCMLDDDGEYELEFFETTIEGLDKCISKVYDRQDELKDPEIFKEKILSIK